MATMANPAPISRTGIPTKGDQWRTQKNPRSTAAAATAAFLTAPCRRRRQPVGFISTYPIIDRHSTTKAAKAPRAPPTRPENRIGPHTDDQGGDEHRCPSGLHSFRRQSIRQGVIDGLHKDHPGKYGQRRSRVCPPRPKQQVYPPGRVKQKGNAIITPRALIIFNSRTLRRRCASSSRRFPWANSWG